MDDRFQTVTGDEIGSFGGIIGPFGGISFGGVLQAGDGNDHVTVDGIQFERLEGKFGLRLHRAPS